MGRAAASTSFDWSVAPRLVGSASSPTTVELGTNSRRSSNCFAASTVVNRLTPVAFPPGRLKAFPPPWTSQDQTITELHPLKHRRAPSPFHPRHVVAPWISTQPG